MLTDSPVLVTADLHLNANPRDEYRFAIFARLDELATKHKAGTILILGDLTDEKDRHPAALVSRIVDGICGLAQTRRVIILRGNHDYVDPRTPFFQFVDLSENVYWINKFTQFDGCLFLPHTTNHQRDWARIVQYEGPFIFAHNAFEGARGEGGVHLHGIPTDTFKGARVIAGDIHNPQKVGPVEYVGAPYTIDFGDSYHPRMLLLHHDKQRSIPTDLPGKIALHVSCVEELATHKYPEGSLLKITVDLEPDERASWPAIQHATSQWARSIGCIPVIIQPRVVLPTEGNSLPVAEHNLTDEQWLGDYAQSAGVRPRLLQTGQFLLGRA